MASEATATGDQTFKDRKVGLILFGIIEILMGLVFFLAICGMVLGRSTCRTCSRVPASSATPSSCATPSLDVKTVIPTIVFLGFAAVCLVTMGVGSIRCRRWARALSLLFGWYWLLTGIVGMFFLAKILLTRPPLSGGGASMPPIIIGVQFAVMFLIYVVLPLVFLRFYSSKSVKATVEYRDPQIRWTDRCPLPVLAVSLLAGWSALLSLVSPMWAWLGMGSPTVFPMFGRLWTGAIAGGLQIGFAIVMAYIAWGAYKLNLRAWWCAVIVAAIAVASAVVNVLCLDPMAIYNKMNFSAAQLEAIRKCGMAGSRWTYWISGLWFLAGFGYLMWVRRFFTQRPDVEDDHPDADAVSSPLS